MSPLTRRNALQIGGSIALGGVAGCATADTSADVPEGRLVELYALNLDDQPRTVRVLLQREGDPVYLESMRAAAFDSDAGKAGGGAFEGYPTTAGRYEVYAGYDEQPVNEWRHYAFSTPSGTDTEGEQCLRINLKLGDRHEQSTPPTLIILTNGTC